MVKNVHVVKAEKRTPGQGYTPSNYYPVLGEIAAFTKRSLAVQCASALFGDPSVMTVQIAIESRDVPEDEPQ